MKIYKFLFLTLMLTSITIFAKGLDDEQPASKFAGEYNFMVNLLEEKVISLAEAIPQDKYSWRPAEGVRSISETYLHLAQSARYLLSAIGAEVPAEYNAEQNVYEASTTNKEEIVKKLKDSFAYYKSACLKLNDEALNKEVSFFGNNVRAMVVLQFMQNHAHEHLGQLISYARMVGVTPPWSTKSEN